MKPARDHRRPCAIIAGCVLLAALLLAGYMLANTAPTWWNATPDTGESALDISRALEQGVASQLTKVRGPGAQPWRVSVRTEDLNAWLNARLPQWLAHDASLPWPKDVRMPQVHIEPGGIEAAAEWNGWIVASAWGVESGGADQAARLVPAGATVGRLPAPFASGVGAWFVPQLAHPVPLELQLGDGRLVRVTGVTFSEGQAVIDCTTIAR